MIPAVYYFVLELKLAHSSRSIRCKPIEVRCGVPLVVPDAIPQDKNQDDRQQATDMIHHLIHLRDR